MKLQISNAEYHADTTRISKSGLDLINKVPAKYYANYLDPNRPDREIKRHFEIGTLVHLLCLEQEKFDSEYIITPKIDRRSNAGKAAYAEFKSLSETKTILTQQDYDTSRWCRDAIMRHPAARDLLTAYTGVSEQTFHFTDEYTGAACKVRTDKYLESEATCLDIKTTQDASPRMFAKSVINYRYDVQGAFYSDGIRQATGNRVNNFIFIAVETEWPYLPAVYSLTPTQMQFGRLKYIQDLEVYQNCLRTGLWPGYSDKVVDLELNEY